MRNFLHNCRSITKEKQLKSEALYTLLLFALSVAVGSLAKLMDPWPVQHHQPWGNFIQELGLGQLLSRVGIWALIGLCIAVYSKRPLRASLNVLVFFIGILLGYYTITISFFGFFPRSYDVLFWVIITLVSPLLAFGVWYAKGKGWLSIILTAFILGFFMAEAFYMEIGYIYIRYHYGDVLFLVVACLVLYKSPRQLLLGIAGGVMLNPLLGSLINRFLGRLWGYVEYFVSWWK